MKPAKKTMINSIDVNFEDMLKGVLAFVEEQVLDGDFSIMDGNIYLINAFSSPKKIRQAFNEGYTSMLVGELMTKIEEFNEFKKPFTVNIFKKGELWAIISDLDVEY
jgi:hypothetical protein